MKMLIVLAIALILVICLVAAAVAFVLIPGRSGAASTASQRIPSPDGSRVLVTSVNTSQADPTAYLTVEFEIRNAANGEVLFRDSTGASVRMRWSMTWLSNSEVKLTSSDIGDYCWAEAPDGSWERSSC
jgi:hypothetical protein